MRLLIEPVASGTIGYFVSTDGVHALQLASQAVPPG